MGSRERALHSDNQGARTMHSRAGRGSNPEAPAFEDPRPPAGFLPTHHSGTTMRGHCLRAREREKRRPDRKRAELTARAPRPALTRPLLPKAFHALAGDRGSAAVGAGSVPPYALRRSRGRGRSRGPDRGCRRAVRPAPQRLLPPPIEPSGRRLTGRRGGSSGGAAVALHRCAEPACSHPLQPPLPPEPGPQRRTPSLPPPRQSSRSGGAPSASRLFRCANAQQANPNRLGAA